MHCLPGWVGAEGELKRKLDRMIRRFLNLHAPKTQLEHMNIQVG